MQDENTKRPQKVLLVITTSNGGDVSAIRLLRNLSVSNTRKLDVFPTPFPATQQLLFPFYI